MTNPNDNTQNVRFAIFDCPEEISEEQLQEIRNFAEHASKTKLFFTGSDKVKQNFPALSETELFQ